jgi:hypothetical protein
MSRFGRRRWTAALVLVALTLAAAMSIALVLPEDGGESREVADEPTARRGGASTAPPSPSGPPPGLETALLPNMRSVDAYDLEVTGAGPDRELRFAAALANLGPGPLLLRPRPASAGCPPRHHPAVQRLHDDADGDGRYQPRREDRLVPQRRRVGCMVRHRDHDHWHFDAMARYSLRLPLETTPLASQDKVSFCLRDNRRVPGQRAVVRREHFGECTRNSRQGISPGWVDVYPADLPGQSLPVPENVDGRVLCLDLAADPLGVLVEADEADNASSVSLRIDGRRVEKLRTTLCG